MSYRSRESYEPTEYEVYIKNTVKCLLWLHSQFNWPQSNELIEAYGKCSYSKKEGDKWVSLLCYRIGNLQEEDVQRVIYNPDSNKAKRIAKWWDEHQKEDEQRKKEENE